MASRRPQGLMPMFVGSFGFDSRGFDSVPRLVAAAASQQRQNEEDPHQRSNFCPGVFLLGECGPMTLLFGCLPHSPNVSTRASNPFTSSTQRLEPLPRVEPP